MNYVTPDFPRRIEIELASRCNLRCTYCPRRFIDNLKGAMSYELFEKIINEIDTASDHPDQYALRELEQTYCILKQ